MKFPTLYGRASNGALMEWSIKVDGNNITVSHGQVDGKLQEKSTKVFGKNIGRANETTDEEQAQKEAKSKWKKQLDKNYSTELDGIGQMLNPMLAYDFRKHGHRIEFPAYTQPKLDGVRCLVYLKDSKIVYMSRGGKQYPDLPHITKALSPLFKDNPDTILDGELYSHGKSLQEIVSAVKKPNKLSSKISFWCFDLVEEDIPWKSRRNYLKSMASIYTVSGIFEFLADKKVESAVELLEQHDYWVQAGFEGVMVRNAKGLYKLNHRSADLQKYKVFMDKEFTIIGHSEDVDGCVIWKVQVAEGITCDVTPVGSKPSRKHLRKIAKQFYGKLLKVKFQAYTDGGNLQFPIGIELDRTDS